MKKEYFCETQKSIDVSSELGLIRETSLSNEAGWGVRVVKGKKSGFAYATSKKLLPKDIALTRDFYGFSKGGKSIFHDDLKLTAEDLIEIVRDMNAELEGVNPNFVGANFSVSTRKLKNPYESLSETLAAISVQAFVSTSTSVGFAYDVSRKKTNPKKVAKRAKKMALASQNPIKPKVGKMLVTLSPNAVGSFMDVITSALSGTNVLAGRSMFADKLGKDVASIKLVDNPLKKTGIQSRGFDDEGSPALKKTLIDGTLQGFLHTIETAKRLGGRAGNASRNYNTLPTSDTTNLIVTGPKGSSGDLLVDWISGAHTISPSGDFSVEAKNAFYQGNPVDNLMICGNVFEMIKTVTLWGKRESFGSVSTPSWTVELDVVA